MRVLLFSTTLTTKKSEVTWALMSAAKATSTSTKLASAAAGATAVVAVARRRAHSGSTACTRHDSASTSAKCPNSTIMSRS